MWIGIILAGIAALVTLLFLALWVGELRWRAGTTLFDERLRKTIQPPKVAVYHERELIGLPAPVQRYFRLVLRDGQPMVREAEVHHVGTFQLGKDDKGWKPFDSVERFIINRPGFLWSASIRMMTGVHMLVRDRYLTGEGGLHAAIGGILTMSRPQASHQLAEGSLQRFLAEAIWMPTALLPSEHLQWTPIDDTTAKATLTDGANSVPLIFRFNTTGEIVQAHATARFFEKNGGYTPLPWTSRCWNYAERGGMRIPLDAEVLWHIPEGDFPYWRGHITWVEYDHPE